MRNKKNIFSNLAIIIFCCFVFYNLGAYISSLEAGNGYVIGTIEWVSENKDLIGIKVEKAQGYYKDENEITFGIYEIPKRNAYYVKRNPIVINAELIQGEKVKIKHQLINDIMIPVKIETIDKE